MIFTGLDLETSGSSHEASVPIQIGIALPSKESYGGYIGRWDWSQPESQWCEVAEGIHGIAKEQLHEAPNNLIADYLAHRWLEKRRVGNQSFCMVGFNVAGFDMPFVKRYLPTLMGLYTRRSVDLNAVCFSMAEPGKASFDRIKRDCKEYAAEQMGDDQWHDAEFDAIAAMYSYEYLRAAQRDGRYWK